MENASKALIIAGAILLSILIIGLGMMVFNNAKEAIDGSNLDAQQIDAFNSKFESYVGNNMKGTKVRTLCDNVKSSNATEDEDKQITITYGSVTGTTQSEIMTLKNSINSGKLYNVTVTFSDTTKLIDTITIEDVTANNN